MSRRLTVPIAGLAALCLLAGCGGSSTTTIIQTVATTTAPPITTAPPATTAPTTTAATAPAGCGQVTFSGTSTTIIVLRGTECPEAVRVAAAFNAGTPPSPWNCGLAHEPLDSYPLPDGSTGVIGFSCGYGTAGDLRAAPHAFIGVAPG